MSDDFQEPQALGWDAIDSALQPIYGDVEPYHWGAVMPYVLGGKDPIQGISAYRSHRQRHHLHYVTYGFSELYEKESDDPRVSGFGFELTFRLACHPDEDPPNWVLNFLQNLGRYVFGTGNVFGVGHTMPLNGPIRGGSDTEIRTISFALDPELGWIDTPHGQLEFLQIVGLTEDELTAIQGWNASRFLDLIRQDNERLITDISRRSHLTNLQFRNTVEQRSAEEGASSESVFAEQIRVSHTPTTCRLIIGALLASDLGRRLAGRIPFGRHFSVNTGEGTIRFEPSDTLTWQQTDDGIRFTLTADQAQHLKQLLTSPAGTYNHDQLPGLAIEIEKTEIKDDDGNVVDVVG